MEKGKQTSNSPEHDTYAKKRELDKKERGEGEVLMSFHVPRALKPI